MSAEYNFNEIVDARFGRRQLVQIRRGIKLVWELIKGYIFTSDKYIYKTSDGYVDKCVDQ